MIIHLNVDHTANNCVKNNYSDINYTLEIFVINS